MNQLVGATDELEIVVGEELVGHLGSEQPASSAGGDRPAVHLLWVGPDQVTESSLVRDLLVPFNQPYLIQRPDLWRQPAVDAEDLAVNEGGHREKIKDFATIFPDIAVPVLVLTLVVEPVNLHTSKYLFTNISAFKYF